MRIIVLTMAIVILAFTACDGFDPCENVDLSAESFVEVGGSDYLGVIIPAHRVTGNARDLDGYEFWTPTAHDIAELEATLRYGLRAVGAAPEVFENLTDYRRQYVGVADDNGRRILVNAFPVQGKSEIDMFCAWRHQYVMVLDGGYGFWRAEFDPRSLKFVRFDHNALR